MLQPVPTLVKPYFHLRSTLSIERTRDRLTVFSSPAFGGTSANPEGGPPLSGVALLRGRRRILADTITARVTTAQRTYES